MGSLKEFVSGFPWLFRWVARIHRYRFARSYYTPKLKLIRKWVRTSRELNNFTYDLQPINLEYLTCFVSEVTGRGVGEVAAYMKELEEDQALKDFISRRISENPRYRMRADLEARYCRRIGWYAIVRAMKPRVVVETGIDKGLGALVLASALMRNAKDGVDGRYFGTDINPEAGYLFQDPYSQWGRILYGDSCESLSRLEEKVDLFINDSDHSAEYEQKEYQTILPKLAEAAVLLGDNAHVTDELFRFARSTGRRFLFFQEWPRDHWYPGAGIGAAFGRAPGSPPQGRGGA